MNVEQVTENVSAQVEKLKAENIILRGCLYEILNTATINYSPKSQYLELRLDGVKVTLKPEDPLYENFKSKWKFSQELKATRGGNK